MTSGIISGFVAGSVSAVPIHATQAAVGSGTLVPLIGVPVSVLVAVFGWWLHKKHRREDRMLADLTEIAQILRDVDLQVRRLAGLGRVVTTADFVELRRLSDMVQRASEQRPCELQQPLADVARRTKVYLTTPLPPADDVTAAYLVASAAHNIPPDWQLSVLLKRAEEQGHAAADVAAAVKTAESKVQQLRGD